MVGFMCPWTSFVVGESPRSLHGIQQSFQETKRETPNRAKPQAVTTSDSRLTDISEKMKSEKKSELNCDFTCNFVSCYSHSISIIDKQ